jgi:hypothetical protein
MKSNIIKKIFLFIPQAIRSVPFVVTKLPQLIVHGGIAVDTPFEYRSPSYSQTRTFFFRTVIQMDADVINFLPEPDCLPNDPDWEKLYEEKYKTHRARVVQLFSKLDGVQSLAWLVSAGLSLVSVTFVGSKFVAEIETLLFRFSFVSLLVFLAYLFRKYLFSYILKLTLHLAGFLIKRRLRRVQV